jgi:hypothetical protein
MPDLNLPVEANELLEAPHHSAPKVVPQERRESELASASDGASSVEDPRGARHWGAASRHQTCIRQVPFGS